MNEKDFNKFMFSSWFYKLCIEEYHGDINLLLLELNIQGRLPKWYFLDENNQVVGGM